MTDNKETRALAWLVFGHFILDGYVAILIPLYPFIAQRLEINIATISFVIAIGHSVSSVLQPVFGYISDNISKRFFMFWGLILASIFMPLGYNAPNAFILTLCLVFGMLGNALYHPQVTKIIKDFYKDNNKLSSAIGIFLGLGTIGYALSPYISTYLAQILKEKYFYIAIFGMVLSFLMLFYVPKINLLEKKNAFNFLEATKEIVSNGLCLLLIVITVIKATLIMSFGTYIPFLLKKFDFSMVQIGSVITAFYIAGGVSMIIASRLEKYFKLRGMIVLSYIPLLPLTVLFLYLLKYNKFLAVFVLILIGFFMLLSAGVVLAYAQKTTTKYVGMISGIIQGLTLAIGSILLVPFGILGQKIGVEYILIIVTAFAFLISIYSYKTSLLKEKL